MHKAFLGTNRTRSLTLVATGLGFVVVLLDVSVVNIALERLREAFGATMSELQWVVNAYTLAFAALLLTAGALGDRFGTRRVFVIGFALFTAASLACGFSTSLNILIVARIMQGLAAAILVPASLSLLNKTFTNPVERSHAVGIWAGVGGIALAVGPTIGGILIQYIGWRSIFFINLPIGLIGIALTLRYAPQTPLLGGRSLDLIGQFAVIVSLGTLTAGVIEAGPMGWSTPLVEGFFLIATVSALAFVFIEANVKAPMLPLGLFRNSTFTTASVVGVLVNLAFYGFVFVLSLFFQEIKGYSPVQTGLAFLPMTAVLTVGNIVAGRLMALRGPKLLMVFGQALAAFGYLLLIPVEASTNYFWMVVPMLLAGSGVALTVPPMTNASLSAVGPEKVGVASGVLNSARQVGGVLGVAIFGYLLSKGNHFSFVDNMHICLQIAAGGLILGSLASVIWVGREQKQTIEDQPKAGA